MSNNRIGPGDALSETALKIAERHVGQHVGLHVASHEGLILTVAIEADEKMAVAAEIEERHEDEEIFGG